MCARWKLTYIIICVLFLEPGQVLCVHCAGLCVPCVGMGCACRVVRVCMSMFLCAYLSPCDTRGVCALCSLKACVFVCACVCVCVCLCVCGYA